MSSLFIQSYVDFFVKYESFFLHTAMFHLTLTSCSKKRFCQRVDCLKIGRETEVACIVLFKRECKHLQVMVKRLTLFTSKYVWQPGNINLN
jgi:hypothetical protein